MGNTTNRTALNSSTSYSMTPDNSKWWPQHGRQHSWGVTS